MRLLGVPFAYALLLLAVPLGAIALFSFWTQDFMTVDTTFTLDNYREVRDSPIYGLLLRRSLMVSGLVTLVTVILAYPVAYFVSFHVAPSKKSLWLFLITIPFWTSYLIRVFLWKVILGYNGVINTTILQASNLFQRIYDKTGLEFFLWASSKTDEPLTFILYNVNAVIITLAHAFAPFAILPIFVVLEKIDRSLLEASRDLGETKLTTFFRVTLPLSMSGVVGATLIVFIPTIGDYVTPELMGGAGGKLIANMIQTQFLQLNNAPLGAALAVVAMVCVAGISLAFVFLNRRYLRSRT